MTRETQAVIEAHQNPEDCSKAKYLVWQLTNNGMGSDLHTLGWALGLAMATNRVLVYHYKR